MHEGPADTPDGHHVAADESPHDGGASIVAGDDAADANVNTAKGAHAAGPMPWQESISSVHERPSAHTAVTVGLAAARDAFPARALIQASQLGAGAMPSDAAVPR